MARSYDVIIVGAGVFGCAVAYELAKRSVSVLLVDKDQPGRATSASAGGRWPVGEAVGLGCGVIYHAAQNEAAEQPPRSFSGPDPLPCVFRDFLVASNARFPDLARELRDSSGIDIEYQPGQGLLFVAFDAPQEAFMNRVRRGLPPDAKLELISPQEVARLEPQLTRSIAGGALLPDEHQVNPMLLAEAFKRAAIRSGAAFRHDTTVTGLRISGDRVVAVEVADEVLPCETVVNAAGAWAAQLAAHAGLKLPVEPVRGQIVLTERPAKALAVCLSTPACYLAQKAHGEILIGSTTERVGFDVSVTEKAIGSLCRAAVGVVPTLCHERVKRVWAGLRPGTPDELPILGPVDSLGGYVNAAGGFRTGIVASPLAGAVVAASVVGEPPPVSIDPFLASRFDDPEPDQPCSAHEPS
jgi:hydrogen cyanide synthase HcnC